MDVPTGRGVLLVSLLVTGVVVGLAIDEIAADYPDEATVTFLDGNGTRLGTVDVRVADSYRERFVGLSLTDSLGPNEGMLFVHAGEGPHDYVMRSMSFPIDIVFVDPEGQITTIHHAEVEDRPLTTYSGRGTRVVEISYEWTVHHDVAEGDRVRIEWGE